MELKKKPVTSVFRKILLLAALISIAGCRGTNTSTVKGISYDPNGKNVALLFVSPQNLDISPDLTSLKNVLEDPAGDYRFEVHLKDQATSSQIVSTIKEHAGKVDEKGTLLVYMAGHGSTVASISTSDYSMIDSKQVVKALQESRQGLPAFKRFVFFVFACNSGSWLEGENAIPAEKLSSDSNQKLFDQALLVASSQNYENSWTDGRGSSLGNAIASSFKELKENAKSKIGNFVELIKSKIRSSKVVYRSFPDAEVLDDNLFAVN